MADFFVNEEAKRELGAIHYFIAEDNPGAADKTVDDFYSLFETIAIFPTIGRPRNDLEDEVRVFGGSGGIERYLVYYFIGEECVEIVRVIHGARDQESLF